MERKRSFLHRILRVADLPQELDSHRFFLQWYGSDECMIEQHRGILCFDVTTVRLATDQGVLCISGESLALEVLTESRAKVTGRIQTLSIEDKS